MKSIVCSLLLMIFCQTSLARWPIFTVPSKDQLLAAGIINTNQCPPGQGKISQGVNLPVKTWCSTYCPDDWQWLSQQETSCFALDQFSYLYHTIEIVREAHNAAIKSIIKSYYGINGAPATALIFTTPENHWSCYDLNPPLHLITCANDM
jgi:hypothetical protein